MEDQEVSFTPVAPETSVVCGLEAAAFFKYIGHQQ